MVEPATENNGPKVEIKTLSDRIITFPFEDTLKTVGNLKALLAAKETISAETIILVSQSAVLGDAVELSTLPSVIQASTQVRTTTVHWFHMELLALTLNPIETAKDWDAKNRLRCFVGIYQLSRRNFVEAASLLTECLATFQDTTFITFKDLVKYTILAAILVLDRPEISKKVHGHWI
jgi:hypothetical protein